MRKILSISLLIMCLSINHAFADTLSEILEKNNLKRVEINPAFLFPCLQLDLALPADFIAVIDNKEDHPIQSTILLGPPDALENYFNDPSSLSQPIISLSGSYYIHQEHVESPGLCGILSNPDDKNLPELLKNKLLSHSNFKWGDYPVKEISVKTVDAYMYLAIAGINIGNSAVLFNLITPEIKPTEHDLKFWRTFLEETKQASKEEIASTLNQELCKGYTIATCQESKNKSKFKITAFEKVENEEVKVVLEPFDENLEIEARYIMFNDVKNIENKFIIVVCNVNETDQDFTTTYEESIIVRVNQVNEYPHIEEGLKVNTFSQRT